MGFRRTVGPAFLFALVIGLAPSATHAKPDEKVAFLRWDIGAPEPTSSPQYKVCHAHSVSWVDAHDRVMWIHALPARMQAVDGDVCVCLRVDGKGTCAAELAYYVDDPRAGVPSFSMGKLDFGRAVAIADASGILVLDKATGDVIFDWGETRVAGDPEYFADSTHYVVEGITGCAGDTFRRAQIFTMCDGKLVWFAGSQAAVFDPRSWTTVAVGNLAPGTTKGKDAAHVSARIPLGGWVLALTGVIYMR